MKKAKTYWFCEIGGVDRAIIPYGGDAPMRQAVQNEFFDMFGEYAEVCSSGWGLSEEMKARLSTIRNSPESVLKQIDAILKNRPM